MVQQIKSKAEFDALRESDKLIFVDFYADWCGPCKQISPVFDRIAEENAKEGVVEFYKADIDELQELASELGIRSIPAFHVYKGGQRLGDVLGANRGALQALVQKHA